jgi:hypothetical protein
MKSIKMRAIGHIQDIQVLSPEISAVSFCELCNEIHHADFILLMNHKHSCDLQCCQKHLETLLQINRMIEMIEIKREN